MKIFNQPLKKTENRVEFFKNSFCQRLKDIRREKCLSQNIVAQKLNCPVSTYANWEQGRTEPSIGDIFNLLIIFEIEANELFDIKNFRD